MPAKDETRRHKITGMAATAAIAAIVAIVGLGSLAVGATVDSDEPNLPRPIEVIIGGDSVNKTGKAAETPSYEEVVNSSIARIRDATQTGLPDAYAYPSVDVTAYHPLVPAYETAVAGMQVIVLVPEQSTGKQSLMFVHGGAYVAQLQEEHMWLASSIARATGAVVYIPVYPLASATTNYEDTYPPMVELYRRLVANGGEKGLTLFGDSAGAGLATGVCEHGADERLPQPENLVLLSPWTNVTEQPWMGLDAAADAWSGQPGGGGQRQWQVSPVYGDVSVLGKVTILNGELDGLSSSIQAFYHQLRGNNVDCTLVSEPGEIHDYAYMVGRSASQRAFNLICTIVSGEASGANGEWAQTLSYDTDSGDAGSTDDLGTQTQSTSQPAENALTASSTASASEKATEKAEPREFSAWPGRSPQIP